MTNEYHIPVLLNSSVDGLNIQPNGVYVDVTFGGGGHSTEILRRLGSSGKLYVFDQDEEALKNAPDDSRIIPIHGNFRYMQNFLRYHKAIPVDGILADLGVSSHHFDTEERGFAHRFNSSLDMRMNQGAGLNAADFIKTADEGTLKQIFSEFGEVENAGKLSKCIVVAREKQEIKTVEDFKKAIHFCIPRGRENKYLAKVFQALRIAVNDEIEALKEWLEQTRECLKPGGRLVVITYHSLEDRLVKNYIRDGNFEGKSDQDLFGNKKTFFTSVTKGTVIADEDENSRNPRARSAKLRIAAKNKE